MSNSPHPEDIHRGTPARRVRQVRCDAEDFGNPGRSLPWFRTGGDGSRDPRGPQDQERRWHLMVTEPAQLVDDRHGRVAESADSSGTGEQAFHVLVSVREKIAHRYVGELPKWC
ncbi:hypothetical protein [Streptomyces sp. NPDC002156]